MYGFPNQTSLSDTGITTCDVVMENMRGAKTVSSVGGDTLENTDNITENVGQEGAGDIPS